MQERYDLTTTSVFDYLYMTILKHAKYNYTCLTDGGSSLTVKNIGQMSVWEDLKRETPSVLSVNDIFAGFVAPHKNPPGLASSAYFAPSVMSLM